MILVAPPEPANNPPRVRLDLTAGTDETISEITVTRDGSPIRDQPFAGAGISLAYDYEAPFGVPVDYQASGDVLPPLAPDWTEPWASLSGWTGDTSDFSVSGAKARSLVTDAKIVRSASGAIQRIDVTDPVYARVELLDSSDVVVASVQVAANVVVAGSTTTTASGGGSFTATLVGGVLSVVAADASWSVSRPFAGVPTKVRVVSLGGVYAEDAAAAFSSISGANAIAVAAGSGNIYTVHRDADLVRKWNAAGVFQASWSTGGTPVGIALDSTETVFVTDYSNSLVRPFSSTGSPGTPWASGGGGGPTGIGVDNLDKVYVYSYADDTIYKFSNTGSPVTNWHHTGRAADDDSRPNLAVLPGGSTVYVVSNNEDTYVVDVVLYNSTGTELNLFTYTGIPDPSLTVDPAGDFYLIKRFADPIIRKYDSVGTFQVAIDVGVSNSARGAAVTAAGVLLVGDTTQSKIRSFSIATASVGTVAEYLAVTTEPFNAEATATLDMDEAWLIHPTFPSLSASIDPGQHRFRDVGLNVELTTKTTLSRTAKATRHDPAGGVRAVIFTSGPRSAGEWDLKLYARTLEDRDQVNSLCEDQSSLLLRTPPSWTWDLPDGWYSVGDYTEDRPRPRLDIPDRIMTLPLTPVDEPVVKLQEIWNYGADLLRNPTYADSRAEFATYLDRLIGP